MSYKWRKACSRKGMTINTSAEERWNDERQTILTVYERIMQFSPQTVSLPSWSHSIHSFKSGRDINAFSSWHSVYGTTVY